VKRSRKLASRVRSLTVNGRDWLQRHVLLSALGTLCTIWFVVAVLAYRFERGAEGANLTSFGDSVWWGIITLLTVGYGDRYPVTLEGRLVGSVLAVSGVVMIGILTARISSYFLEQALKAGRGVVDTDRLEDHFVVCGWKEEMHILLSHILDFNPGLKATSLVVIANVPNTWIDEVRAVKRLEHRGRSRAPPKSTRAP
jgi:voltage-gated potassium channel